MKSIFTALFFLQETADVAGKLTGLKQLFESTLQTFTQKFSETLPSIVGALVVLILGWILAKLISYTIRKVLTVSKFDELADKMNISDMFERANIKSKPSRLISRFVYWVIILFAFVMASDALGLDIISQQISSLISYLPTLFSALVMFLIGVFISSFVRDIISATTNSLGVAGGSFISSIVFWLLLIMFTIMVLNQLNIDTEIITYQVLLMIGSILLAGSISYGFASRKVLSGMLATYFSRHTYSEGQVIRIGDIEGEIVKVDKIFITIKTDVDKVVIPTKDLLDARVHILRDVIRPEDN